MVPFILTDDQSDTFGNCFRWGCSSIQSCNSLTNFQIRYYNFFSLVNLCINLRKIKLEHETFFKPWMALLYIARIEQENIVYDDMNEYVRTFLISYFLSTLDISFSGISTIIISNTFYRQVIWGESLSFCCLFYYLN